MYWCLALLAHISDWWELNIFPQLGFLRTFSMLFWTPHRNYLSWKKLFYNLFYEKRYFAWTTSVVHFFVIWITVLLLVSWRITRNTITQVCVKLLFGENNRLRPVLWPLWYFHNETCSGGYLGHGWEGIRGKELWLWLPEAQDCPSPELQPRSTATGAPLSGVLPISAPLSDFAT